MNKVKQFFLKIDKQNELEKLLDEGWEIKGYTSDYGIPSVLLQKNFPKNSVVDEKTENQP